jgi:hypothetical protein
MVNELLQNIRFLKFYGWGNPSLKLFISYIYTDARVLVGDEGARRQGDRNGMASEKEYRWCHHVLYLVGDYIHSNEPITS